MTQRDAVDVDAVNALVRGFDVLNCVATARRPLTLTEVAQRTHIPKPTVSRLLTTLVGLGQVRAAREGQGYELAAGVVRLAETFLNATDVRHWARPHVAALAEGLHASAFLGVRDNHEMLVIEAARSRSAVAWLGADVGTRMALDTSALGRAWLAGVDAPIRTSVLARLRRSPALRRSLDAELARARAHGFVMSIGEFHPNINAVAVPILTPGGEVVALNCGGPSFLMPPDKIERTVVPRLLRAAQAFARDIGGVCGVAVTAGSSIPPSTTNQLRAAVKRQPKIDNNSGVANAALQQEA